MKSGRQLGMAWLAWSVATGLGIGAGWVGLGPVLRAAVPDRVAPLSAADVRNLALPSTAILPRPALSQTGPLTSGPTTRPASGPGSPRRSSAAAEVSPASSPSLLDGWTVTTQSDGSLTYLRRFEVRGGSAVIRIVSGQVHLVSATPNAAYSVQTSQSDPTRLVVQFTADSKYDIVDAMWWNSRPYAQVSQVG